MAAGLVGALGERLADVERLGAGPERLADLLEADHAGEAVGAEEQDVAAADLGVREVDLYGVGRTERLQDDVVVLEGLGLFLGELAGFDELVHERLIARELHERVAAEDVAARVADLREEEDLVHERRRGDGRAHAAARAVGFGLVEDAEPGGLDGSDEATREVVALDLVGRRGRRRAARR